jgi:hypothetical protein
MPIIRQCADASCGTLTMGTFCIEHEDSAVIAAAEAVRHGPGWARLAGLAARAQHEYEARLVPVAARVRERIALERAMPRRVAAGARREALRIPRT